MVPRPSAEAGTTQADEPSGYEVDLKVPQQSEEPDGLATPPLRTATVTLPAGVSISPAAADGLLGCRETGAEGIELTSNAPGHCPEKSKVGTVTVITPLLKEPLDGSVYVAQPGCAPCSEAQAEKGEVFDLYLEVGSKNSGVHIKLPGTVEVGGNGTEGGKHNDLEPGQIRTTFANAPQDPFSELKLHLNGEARAPLANPQTCGEFTTTSALTPWSSEAPATPASQFNVDWDGAKGACPASLPFGPSFSAGTINPRAAAFSPFTLTFSRHDREQDLSGITVSMPQGLLGKIAGIPQCGEAEANAGTCSAASRIGSATAAAGAGSHPFWQSGQVFLTGPYNGAPFGLSVVVPAVAGPYNLGNIVVRARIYVDPHTAQLTVISNPLPQSVDGVPLRVQTINVTTDRPGFMFNSTSCVQQAVGATIGGLQGASANVASQYAVAGCRNLPFKPSFTVSTQGKTIKAAGASLDVKVAAKPGEANVRKVDVQLPLALPARLTTLQKACTEAQFNANPAGCPAASDVGVVTVHTPLLNVPLTGPAYFVSHGGAAFPDLDLVLQGENITIVLVGNTDIKHGITYSRFESVPDAPFSSFELNAPEGPHSILAANGNLCWKSLAMPTTLVGQNGAVIHQSTPISVTGCSSAMSIASHRIKKRKLTLKVYVPAAGKLTASGKGVSIGRKTSKGRGTVTIILHQKHAGRLHTRLRVVYTPTTGKVRKRQVKTLKLRFRK